MENDTGLLIAGASVGELLDAMLAALAVTPVVLTDFLRLPHLEFRLLARGVQAWRGCSSRRPVEFETGCSTEGVQADG